MLELYEGKLSRTVLRRERGSNPSDLADTGIIKSQIKKSGWKFAETFGYETKFKREQVLGLEKTHYFDAVAICCRDNQKVDPDDTVYFKRHVSGGDYRQTKGKRSQTKIPTGKLFGLRKFDLIKTVKGIGFVKGKRTRGYFSICDIFWNDIDKDVNIKKNCKRLRARSTTLIQRKGLGEVYAFPPEAKDFGVLC